MAKLNFHQLWDAALIDWYRLTTVSLITLDLLAEISPHNLNPVIRDHPIIRETAVWLLYTT